MLLKKDLQNITVAELCEYAHISRTTFYKNYDNTRLVVEGIIEELISETLDFGNELFACIGEKKTNQISMCELIRHNKKYLPIIRSDEIAQIFVERLSEKIDDKTVIAVCNAKRMKADDVRTLFEFQLSGCVNQIRKNYELTDKEWKEKKKAIDSFLKSGYKID